MNALNVFVVTPMISKPVTFLPSMMAVSTPARTIPPLTYESGCVLIPASSATLFASKISMIGYASSLNVNVEIPLYT